MSVIRCMSTLGNMIASPALRFFPFGSLFIAFDCKGSLTRPAMTWLFRTNLPFHAHLKASHKICRISQSRCMYILYFICSWTKILCMTCLFSFKTTWREWGPLGTKAWSGWCSRAAWQCFTSSYQLIWSMDYFYRSVRFEIFLAKLIDARLHWEWVGREVQPFLLQNVT